MTVTITRGKTTATASSFKKAKKKLDKLREEKKSVDKSKITKVKAGSKTYTGKVQDVQGKKVYVGIRGVSKKEQADKAKARTEKKARQKARENLRAKGVSEKEFRERTNTPTRKERAEQAAEQVVIRRTTSPYSAAVPRSQKIFIKEAPTRKDEPRGTGKLADRDSGGRNPSQVAKEKAREERIEKLLAREQRLETFKTAVYERTGLARRKGEPYLVSAGKEFVKGFTVEVATLPVYLGGRAAFAAESLFSKEGRQELKRAAKNTPKVVLKSFNPKRPEGLANIALAALAVRGVAKSKAVSGKTELELKPYKTAERTTYVGEGTFRGRKAKAVVVEKGGKTRTYIRTGKNLLKSEGGAGSVEISEFKLSSSRELKPVFQGKGFEKSRYLGEEVLKTEVKGKSVQGRTVAEVDLKQTELVKSRIDTTPEVTRIYDTRIGEAPRQVRVREATFEFGKEKFPKDVIAVEKTKTGTQLRQTLSPKAVQKATRIVGAEGKLRITERPMREVMLEDFARKNEALIRSRKGQLLIQQERAIGKVKPSVATEFNIPQVSLPATRANVLPVVSPMIRPSVRTETRTKAFSKTRFEPVVKVDLRQITKAQQKPEVRIDYRPVTRLKQDPRLKTGARVQTKLKTATLTPAGAGPGFSISTPSISTPIVPPPLLRIQSLQMEKGKRKGKGTKAKGKKKYRPSIVGIQLGIKQKGRKTRLTGYGVRGL